MASAGRRAAAQPDGMEACSANTGARIGTDWITELMDSDLDVNDLQVSVTTASMPPASTGVLLLK